MLKLHKVLAVCTLIGLCVFSYLLGYNRSQNVNDIVKAKNEIITELNKKHKVLISEHKKDQEVLKATTEEIKRLTQELKEYKDNKNTNLDFKESDAKLGFALVSDHIKQNEAYSSIAYCDSDGKYRNGYGTLAKMVTYTIGEIVELRDCTGKRVTITVTETNKVLPERVISEKEALKRKENHLIKYVFPYLYGKHFHSQEEFIVATDVIYNRGISQCKNLFNEDGTINCQSLYKYMDHSKAKYQATIRKRYAKNYALCIQS